MVQRTPNVHFAASWSIRDTTKIPQKDPQRENKKELFSGREKEKKSAILGGLPPFGVTLRWTAPAPDHVHARPLQAQPLPPPTAQRGTLQFLTLFLTSGKVKGSGAALGGPGGPGGRKEVRNVRFQTPSRSAPTREGSTERAARKEPKQRRSHGCEQAAVTSTTPQLHGNLLWRVLDECAPKEKLTQSVYKCPVRKVVEMDRQGHTRGVMKQVWGGGQNGATKPPCAECRAIVRAQLATRKKSTRSQRTCNTNHNTRAPPGRGPSHKASAEDRWQEARKTQRWLKTVPHIQIVAARQ